jgi:hypothetical protein
MDTDPDSDSDSDRDADPYPAIFVSDLQDVNKNYFFSEVVMLITF